jgi:HEPN domain-containing protein
MNDHSYTPAQILLLKAAEDEAVLLYEKLPEAIFGFHAQQSVEKLIKALLSQLNVAFELTHNLARLQRLLIAAGETLPPTPMRLAALNDFSVFYRYDLLFQYAVPEKNDVLETVRLIREHVVARIDALSSAT